MNFAPPSLTEREIIVIRLVAQGLSNKEIACKLGIKERTVEFHLCNIFQKFNVCSRTAAAMSAQKIGILND